MFLDNKIHLFYILISYTS